MTPHISLTIGVVVSFVVVIARIFYPASDSLVYRVFDAVFWLSASFIPGYLVYLLVAYLPRRRDQRILGPFIANQSALLVGDGQSLLSELEKASGHKAAIPATKADFDAMCAQIQPQGQAPMLKGTNPLIYANWLELISYKKARSERHADQLLQYMPYMEAEHVRIVTEIRDCVLFTMVGFLSHIPANKDLTFLAEPLFGHYLLTRELAAYSDAHLKGLAWSKPRK